MLSRWGKMSPEILGSRLGDSELPIQTQSSSESFRFLRISSEPVFTGTEYWIEFKKQWSFHDRNGMVTKSRVLVYRAASVACMKFKSCMRSRWYGRRRDISWVLQSWMKNWGGLIVHGFECKKYQLVPTRPHWQWFLFTFRRNPRLQFLFLRYREFEGQGEDSTISRCPEASITDCSFFFCQ